MPSSRFHYDLPSNKAGREVNRDSSWQVAPAISLERGTGVGVNRHSSRLLRGEMIRERLVGGWWCYLLLVCLEGGGGGIMMGWKAFSTSPSQLQSEEPVLE